MVVQGEEEQAGQEDPIKEEVFIAGCHGYGVVSMKIARKFSFFSKQLYLAFLSTTEIIPLMVRFSQVTFF